MAPKGNHWKVIRWHQIWHQKKITKHKSKTMKTIHKSCQELLDESSGKGLWDWINCFCWAVTFCCWSDPPFAWRNCCNALRWFGCRPNCFCNIAGCDWICGNDNPETSLWGPNCCWWILEMFCCSIDHSVACWYSFAAFDAQLTEAVVTATWTFAAVATAIANGQTEQLTVDLFDIETMFLRRLDLIRCY